MTKAEARAQLKAIRHLVARLPNALTVVVVPMPHAHRVVVDAHVRVGSRFETAQENGLSHFLEHMLYRGTKTHPSAHAQALAFEKLGGTLAAATYVDHMSLSVAVPPHNFESLLPLFADVFVRPVFHGIEVEKGIVREEILEALDDEGREIDPDNLVRDLCFGSHPLGYPITGTLTQLDSFDLARLRAHHAKHFHAPGTVLVVAGPVKAERVTSMVERHFAVLPRGGTPHAEPPERQNGPRFRFVRHVSSQTALRVAFHAPGEREPHEPATELLLRVIDDGMSTRLYHRVCDERGLCYDVSAAYEAYHDCGLLDLAAESAHDRAGAVLGELLDLTHELVEHGPSEDELDKAKLRHEWQLAEMLDDPSEVAEFFALGELTQVARDPAERAAQLSAVTRDQVRAAAERTFRREAASVVAVGLQPRRAQDALARQLEQRLS